jgi:hypothetical protein
MPRDDWARLKAKELGRRATRQKTEDEIAAARKSREQLRQARKEFHLSQRPKTSQNTKKQRGYTKSDVDDNWTQTPLVYGADGNLDHSGPCKSCGSVIRHAEVVTFSDNWRHTKIDCAKCGLFIRLDGADQAASS